MQTPTTDCSVCLSDRALPASTLLVTQVSSWRFELSASASALSHEAPHDRLKESRRLRVLLPDTPHVLVSALIHEQRIYVGRVAEQVNEQPLPKASRVSSKGIVMGSIVSRFPLLGR